MNTITIKFTPEKILSLPFAHFSILQGLFYNLLSFNKDLSTEIHNKKGEKTDAIKLCTFSDLSGYYSKDTETKTLYYKNSFLFEIRSVDERVIDTIQKHLQAKTEFLINGCKCTVESFKCGDVPLVTDCCTYIMDTPITVYHTNDNYRHYYDPSEYEFCELVEGNLKKKYELVFNKEYDGKLVFEPVYVTLKDKCVTFFHKKTEDTNENLAEQITAYYGKYRLTADENMQKVAYLCGFGSNNSSGFGFAHLSYR